MIKGVDAILISSEDPKKLSDFYKEKVGLDQKGEMEYGEDGSTAYEFDLKNLTLVILPHSEIKGQNPNPARIMVNIEVDDCEAECKKVKDAGVNCIQEVYHVENYGLICTFEDPDGNYFQLVQVRE